jgi:hypothetical protein
MRDPNRITRILSLIEMIWEKKYDLRFFQLIESIFGCPVHRNQCFFGQEDDITEQMLMNAAGLAKQVE